MGVTLGICFHVQHEVIMTIKINVVAEHDCGT